MNRRDFLKKAGIATAAVVAPPAVIVRSKSPSGGDCKPTPAARWRSTW